MWQGQEVQVVLAAGKGGGGVKIWACGMMKVLALSWPCRGTFSIVTG